jgi:hypothetical protein
MPNSKVSIFWDNSNIYIPAQFVANKRDRGFASREVRVHFQNLFDLARAGRPVDRAVCVGSVPPELEIVWKHLKKTGVKVELYERGEGSGSEQGVDQCLQVHMLRSLTDLAPGVVVILTGDGAGYDSGTGYHADLERMHRGGWGVEVISWDCAVNKKLKTWAEKEGVYIPLENYYDSVTFSSGTRDAKHLSLTHRPTVKPKP